MSKCFIRDNARCAFAKSFCRCQKNIISTSLLEAPRNSRLSDWPTRIGKSRDGTVQPWDPALRIPRSLKEPALYSLFDCRSLQSSLNNCFLLSCLRGPANDTHYAWRWLLGPASLASLRLPSCIVHHLLPPSMVSSGQREAEKHSSLIFLKI